MKLKKTNGVTLIALVITIMILSIIAGIAFYSGREIIQKANLESLRTNMLLIQAKAREYVETATFKMGINPDDDKKNEVRQEVYENEALLEKASSVPGQFGISDTSTCYLLTNGAKEKWGLQDIELKENEKYIIQFDEANEKVEVYNTEGFDGKYSLTDINEIEL